MASEKRRPEGASTVHGTRGNPQLGRASADLRGQLREKAGSDSLADFLDETAAYFEGTIAAADFKRLLKAIESVTSSLNELPARERKALLQAVKEPDSWAERDLREHWLLGGLKRLRNEIEQRRLQRLGAKGAPRTKMRRDLAEFVYLNLKGRDREEIFDRASQDYFGHDTQDASREFRRMVRKLRAGSAVSDADIEHAMRAFRRQLDKPHPS